jgi:drug/metabolite transporter (DMT)-like permease
MPLEFFGAAQREGLTLSYGGGIGWYLMIIASALSIAVTVIMLRAQDHKRWMRGIMLLPLGFVLLAAGFYLYSITEGAWFYRPDSWGILLAYLGTILTTYATIHILAFRKLRAGQMIR